MIEFQKRGLPHAHILIILAPEDRLKTVDHIDECVSAELPLPPNSDNFGDQSDPANRHAFEAATAHYEELLELIVTNMTHHECGPAFPGASCMVNGVCKGHFPKPFYDETTHSEDQIYPLYRCRAPDRGGAVYTMRSGRVVDNSVVVPHSPYLLYKYKCHLNVEVCFSLSSVKYLYKCVPLPWHHTPRSHRPTACLACTRRCLQGTRSCDGRCADGGRP